MVTKTHTNPKTNDARRLLDFLKRTRILQTDVTAPDGWLRSAGLPVAGVTEDEKVTIAYEIIVDFRRLLDRVESRYSEIASSDGYKTVIAHYRVVANAQFVHGQWSSVQNHFSIGQSQIVVEAIADALPNDSDYAGLQHAIELLKEIDALLAQVSVSDLPMYHRHYAQMMLDKLRSALRQYIMLGPQSAYEYSLFLQGVDAEIADKQSELKQEHANISEEGQSLIDRILEKTKKATELCKSIYYVSGASIIAYKGGEKVLPLLRRAADNLLQ